jgi:type IV secretory pathway TrbD component
LTFSAVVTFGGKCWIVVEKGIVLWVARGCQNNVVFVNSLARISPGARL